MDHTDLTAEQQTDAEALHTQVRRDIQAALCRLRWQLIALQAHLDQLEAAILAQRRQDIKIVRD